MVSNEGISFFSAAALGSITKACTEVTASMTTIIIAATVLCLAPDKKRVTRAIISQANPHLKYPGKRTPTIFPAMSRLYDLKIVGVRIKVNRDAPPTQQETARRYRNEGICIGSL